MLYVCIENKIHSDVHNVDLVLPVNPTSNVIMSNIQEINQNNDETENNTKESSEASSESENNNVVPQIINELLCYVQFHMRQAPKDLISEVIKRFYSEEEVLQARDVLLKVYDGQFVYEMKNRRNSKPSVSTKGRSKHESFIEDILCVMYELDKKRIVMKFAAINLARLPKCDPREVDPYSNLQLILDLKERIQNLEDGAGSIHAQLITHTDNVNANSREIAIHTTALLEHEDSIADHEKCIESIALQIPSLNIYGKNKDNRGNKNGVDKGERGANVNSKQTNNADKAVGKIDNSKIGDSGSVGITGSLVAINPVVKHANSGSKGGSYAVAAALSLVSGPAPSAPPLSPQGASNIPSGQQGLVQTPIGQGNSFQSNTNAGNRRPSNGMNNNWNIAGRNNSSRRGSNYRQGNRDNHQRSVRGKFQGTATNAKFSGARPPKRDFFISRVESNTDEQDIREHLYCSGINDFELFQTSNVHAKFKSFRLTVYLPDKEKVLSPNLWPVGVCVDKYRGQVDRHQFVNNNS